MSTNQPPISITTRAALRRPRFGPRCLLATIVSLAVLASALALAPIALGAGANGTIEGIVSAEKGAPKFAVEVVVFRESAGGYARLTQTATGAGGEYSVSVAPGNYKLEFVPSNKAFAYIYYKGQPTLAKAKPVTVLEGETVFAEQALPGGDTILGHVTGEGAGLSGATVNAYSTDGQLAATTTSGGEGTYEVAGLPPEEYVVQVFEPAGSVFAPGYYLGKLSLATATPVVFTAPQEVQQPIDVALAKQAQVEGVVSDSVTHQPIGGVTVAAIDTAEPSFDATATTNSVGKYRLTNLPSGAFVLTYALRGETGPIDYAPVESATELGAGETLPRNIQLVPGPPSPLAPPVASGTPTVGGALTCAPGSWSGPPPIVFLYRWLRDGTPITASGPANTYVVQAADQGHAVQCEVIASTAGGEASARSNTLGVAAAPVVPVPGGPPTPTPTPSPMPKPSTLPQIAFSTSKVVFAKRVASVHIACTPVATCVGTVAADRAGAGDSLARKEGDLAQTQDAGARVRLVRGRGGPRRDCRVASDERREDMAGAVQRQTSAGPARGDGARRRRGARDGRLQRESSRQAQEVVTPRPPPHGGGGTRAHRCG